MKLLEQISSKWHEIGILLGQQVAALDNYRRMTDDNVKRCLRVFSDWINRHGHPPDYPLTWDGLGELLSDIEHETAAIRLKEVLKTLKK